MAREPKLPDPQELQWIREGVARLLEKSGHETIVLPAVWVAGLLARLDELERRVAERDVHS